jgi:hypothetical protein
MTAISLAPIAFGGVAFAWGFMGLAFWILLGALIVLVVRGTRTPARDSAGGAVRVLEERYARGEITRENFLERRAMLGGSTPALPPTTRSSRRHDHLGQSRSSHPRMRSATAIDSGRLSRISEWPMAGMSS